MPTFTERCRDWEKWTRSVIGLQRRFIEAQHDVAQTVLNAATGATDTAASAECLEAEAETVAKPDIPDDDLVTLATERMRRGLAPPPEIYRVENRDKIDWRQFPDWARPVDPENFAECGHEG